MSRSDEQQSSSEKRAQQAAEREERARERIKKLEQEGPPERLEDWPDDEAKYLTYGGGEGEHGYDEGPEAQLGPSSLERHEDGSITIEGEPVDNPDDYKSDEPVTGKSQVLPDPRKAGGEDA